METQRAFPPPLFGVALNLAISAPRLEVRRYFGEERPACLGSRLRYLDAGGDLIGRRPDVFWQTFRRRIHIFNARDPRPLNEVG